jgi:hypothetical protein
LKFATAGSASGEVNTNTIQSDWAQTDATKLDYIKNKPEIGVDIEENSSKLATSGAVFEAIKKIASAGGIAYEAGKLTKIENNTISSTLGEKIGETEKLGTFLYASSGAISTKEDSIWWDLDITNNLDKAMIDRFYYNDLSNKFFNLKIRNSSLEEAIFSGFSASADILEGLGFGAQFFNIDLSKITQISSIEKLPVLDDRFPAIVLVLIVVQNYSIPVMMFFEDPSDYEMEVYI